MSSLEFPPPSPTHLPPEKLPETESSEPMMYRTMMCASSSTDHKQDDRHTRIMENFKGMIFKFAISSSPTKSLSPMQRFLIEKQLDEVFPSFRTPVHPPYTAMVESAIKELGEEGGSSEEGISQFIRKEYPDLPWAHDALLKHHLGNLCENGSIVKTCNGLYMFQKVVSNQGSSSAHSPLSSIDAYSRFSLSPDCIPSSNSWSDSSSYCSSRRPKRKRQMYTRRSKKQGRRKWSKNKRSNRGNAKCTGGAQVAKRRRRRPLKQYVSEDETEASDELLMLELMSEETEDDNESEEECSDGVDSINEVSGKRQRIMKQDQRQETGLVMEIQMDNHEDAVDERQREPKTRGTKERTAHPRPRCVPRRRGRPCNQILSVEKTQPSSEEIGTDIQYSEKAEVSKEKYRIDKELADAVKSHDQVQEHSPGALESSHSEDICAMSNIRKSESVREVKKLKPCNCVKEVVPEKDEGVKECDERKQHDNVVGIEEHKAVPDQEHSVGRKRRGRPPKNSVKQSKVELNPKRTPGRPRGRPRKKDLSVEKTQPKEQQIQDPVLEKITEVPVPKYDTSKEVTEVVEEHNQSQGNLYAILERSPSGEIKMEKENEKSKAEEKKLRKQFNLVIEGVSESDEAAKGCDGQKELKKFIESEEETQFEEPNWGLKQDQSNQQKGRGKLLHKGTKGREVHKKHSRLPGRSQGRPRKKDILVERTETKAEQAETTDTHELMLKENTEVPKENCEINKESTKEVEECDELEKNMHGTPEWSLLEKTNFVKEVRKPGSDAEENIEMNEDCCKMEDRGIKGINEQKESENSFNEKQNQFSKEMNEMTFEENQQKRHENEVQNQHMEEGLKDCCILEGEEQQGCGVKEFNGQKEPGDAFDEEQDHSSEEKNEVTVEENQPQREENEAQNQQKKGGLKDCCMTEGEKQQDCNVEGSSTQKEAGKAFDEEQDQFAEEKNETSFEKNQPKRPEKEEQNQQQEDGLKSVTEEEIEVPEMFGHDTQIQENIQLGGEYDSITKTLLLDDVAERGMDEKAIVFPKQSFDSVLQGGKKISNSSMEEIKQMSTEDKVLETDGRQAEVSKQQPESSTACDSQLKSVERSSLPKNLLQQQHKEEKLVDGQLRTHSQKSKSYDLCSML